MLLAVVAAGVLAIGAYAVLHRTALAFTLGVSSAQWAATLQPHKTACQTPIDVPTAFDRVAIAVGTYHRPGSALDVTVREPGGRLLAQGRLAAGYPDIGTRQLERVTLDSSVSAPRIAVCVRDAGPGPAALYGNASAAARGSTAIEDGRDLHTDMTLIFERRPRSLASVLPAMAERAALFRFADMSPWIYLVLAVAVLLAAPWLLSRALRDALADSE